MVDTVRTLSALQALLADNIVGDITAQDLRDMLVSVYPSSLFGIGSNDEGGNQLVKRIWVDENGLLVIEYDDGS